MGKKSGTSVDVPLSLCVILSAHLVECGGIVADPHSIFLGDPSASYKGSKVVVEKVHS